MELSDIKKGDLFVDNNNNYYIVTLLPFHSAELDINYVFGVTELDNHYWVNDVKIVHTGTEISLYNAMRLDVAGKPCGVFNPSSEGYYIEVEEFNPSPLSHVTANDGSISTTVTDVVTSFHGISNKKKIWLHCSSEDPLKIFKCQLNEDYVHAKQVVELCRTNLNEAEEGLKRIEDRMGNSVKAFTDWLYEIKNI